MPRLFSFLCLVPMLALTACGASDPSETDIKAVIEKQFEKTNQMVGGLAGLAGPNASGLEMNLKSKVLNLDKHWCKPSDGPHTVLCSFTVTFKAPMVGEQTVTMERRFIKGSDGWQPVM